MYHLLVISDGEVSNMIAPYAAEYGEIMEFCNEKYGEVKKSTFRTYIISCTVNHNSRIHYSPNKKERSELIDNDVLFQVEKVS